MLGDIGDGLYDLIKWLFIIACIAAPFAIWKIIEIIFWLFKHVDINII